MAVVDGASRWRARGAWRHCLRWAREPPQGVGDGGDDKTWTLTQRVGNPSFLSLPLSFSASLLVPLNWAGVKTQSTAAGARCRAACNQLLHAGRRRVARAPTSVRASAAAASCVRGGSGGRRGSGWRGRTLRGLFG